MTKLIVGCGYLGRRVAMLWLETGSSVAAVTRSGAKAKELKLLGIEPVVADIVQSASLGNLPESETVLFAVGYNASSGRSRGEFYVHGLLSVLNALSPRTKRFIFISSTAVYGQTDGQWVDEDSPCQGKTEVGRAFLEAENVLASSQLGPRALILRLAGLYGPGRLSRRIRDLQAGTPIISAKDRFLNLIHVEDAAAIVAAAEIKAKPPRTFIVADGHPVKYHDYITDLAKLAGAPDPQFIKPACLFNQTDRSTNKRLSNARMLSELDVQLKYPTYKEGLRAILATKLDSSR